MSLRELLPKDWEKIEMYMKSGSTVKRIIDSLGIDLDFFKISVKQRYGQDYEVVLSKFRSQGELLLETVQFQKALAGNVNLLLWLGRTRLGQREPDQVSSMPPAQDSIEKDHTIMKLQHRINILNEMLEKYGHKPEAK